LFSRFERSLRIGRALVGIGFHILWIIPSQSVMLRVQPRGKPYLPRLFFKGMSRALGFKVEVSGAPVMDRPVLFVANHVSWVDIPVMASRLLASFVAKAEVGEMGFVGWMAGLQRTIYVRREARGKVDEQRNEIAERLLAGDSIILYPEGTSSSGNGMLPFKSSLFGVTDTPGLENVLIQPVTLAYTHLNGLPMLRQQRYKVAWIGDMELGDHAFGLVSLGKVRALLHFHPPVTRAEFKNRKDLAKHCEGVIGKTLKRINAGHPA
jgi:lyso-ornithine lipid O-acyltransferase